MPYIKQLQISENVYNIHDVTARASLAGKQDTISDLSTIRTNASNAKTKSDTAISRLNNFKVSVNKFIASGDPTVLPGVSTAGLIGAQRQVACYPPGSGYLFDEDYEESTEGVWLGTLGWHTVNTVIVTYITHSSGFQTNLFIRNLTTSNVSITNVNTWTREAFIVLG